MINEVLQDAKTQVFPVAASTAHARGDLAFWDGTQAKSAGEQTDQLSEQANQRTFAALFAGVFQDTRLATQTAVGEAVLVADGIYDCPCDSATFAIGDLIAAQETGAGTALENSKVKATTDPLSAIGYVVKNAASAVTTVRCRLVSKFQPAVLNAGTTYSFVGDLALTSGADITFAGTTGQSRITFTDNLADGLSIGEGATSYMTFVSTNSAEGISMKKDVTMASGVDLIFSGTTGQCVISITDNLADALSISESSNAYLTFCTTNSGEKVTLGKALQFKAVATPVAATGAGGGVSGAAALGNGNVLYVSSDGATKGVKFLTSAAGDVKWVINTSSTACNLFAASGGTINGGAGDAGCAIPASKGVLAYSSAADTWTIFDMAAHAGAAA